MNQRELKLAQNRLTAWEYELETNAHGFQYCAQKHVNSLKELLKNVDNQSGPIRTPGAGTPSQNG